jgi:hypothetical protein
MKALVLTYDRYRCLTEHMIHQYRRLWPDNPFTFRIPYQDLAGAHETDREYVQCPSDIKSTALALLEGLDDQEWVFWCIDDKYPVALDLPRVRAIMTWLDTTDDSSVDGILCCRPKKLMKQKRLTGTQVSITGGITLLERKHYKCIWIHQFLRAKVLKHLFAALPEEIPDAKTMDGLKEKICKPDDHRLYVSADTLMVFGESTSRGVLTRNCYRSLRRQGLPLPDWHNGKLAGANMHGKMPARLAGRLRNSLFSQARRTS